MFSKLPKPMLATLARVAGYQRNLRHEVIVDQNEPDNCLYVLLNGHASMHARGMSHADAALGMQSLQSGRKANRARRSARRAITTARRRPGGVNVASSLFSSAMLQARRLRQLKERRELQALQDQQAMQQQQQPLASPPTSAPSSGGFTSSSGSPTKRSVPTTSPAAASRRIGNIAQLMAGKRGARAFRRKLESIRATKSREAPAALAGSTSKRQLKTSLWHKLRERAKTATGKGSVDDMVLSAWGRVAESREDEHANMSLYYHPMPSSTGVCTFSTAAAGARVTVCAAVCAAACA